MKTTKFQLDKIKTGATPIKDYQSLSEYHKHLKKETLTTCKELSNLIFAASNQINKKIENKNLILSKVQEIEFLEKDNEVNLLNYLKDLILAEGQIEFIVPYFSISNNVGHEVEHDITIREHHHFGILGEAIDILS
jgi:hypothetical protein